MSAAVTTTTFDQSNPSSRSSPTKRAWASVERIVMPNQAPGKTRSSAYFASPVSFAGPSRRSGPPPRASPGTIVPGATMSGSGAARVGATGLVRVGGVRIVIDAGGSLLSADDTKGPAAGSVAACGQGELATSPIRRSPQPCSARYAARDENPAGNWL